VREQSETRKELEQSVRSLLPEDISLGEKADGETPNIAAIGLGGLFTGYLWGWMRGRKSSKARR
jgi:hypothetical protein